MEMDDGLGLEIVINQAYMAAERDVTVVAWRRRQAARQIGRCGVHLLSQVLVQHGALMQARFLVGRQSVLVPEADGPGSRRTSRALRVGRVRQTELTLLVSIAPLPPVLCKGGPLPVKARITAAVPANNVLVLVTWHL